MYIRITAYDVLGVVHLTATGLELNDEGQPVAVWTRNHTFPLSRHTSLQQAEGLACVAEELNDMAYRSEDWSTTAEHR